MDKIPFNTSAGSTVKRELLIVYLNTGTYATPVWSPIGKRVTDSAMEMDWSEETNQDILGSTYTTLKKPAITQTFEPGDLDGGDAAQVQIWNLAVRNQDYAALTAQDVLIVHFYAGSASTPFAERYTSCAVRPSGLGGEGGGNIGMPLDVTYGGTRIVGKASKDASTGAVTFTPDSAPTLPKLATLAIADTELQYIGGTGFDADVTSYVGVPSASSGTVTATAATAGSTIVILVNGSSIASGGTATWLDGDNIVTVTVSYGGVSNTYEVYISYTD